MGSLTVTPAGSFSDPDLKPLLDGYRQVVAQRYTPCSVMDLPRLLADPPFFVSRKMDGELWFLVSDGGSMTLVAANGRIATGDVSLLKSVTIPEGTVLAGELHAERAGGRERVGDVRTGLAGDATELQFSAFDVIRHEGVTWRECHYPQRLEILRSLLSEVGAVRALPVGEVSSDAEVVSAFNEVANAGGEGIIVRCSDGRALKVKPEITVDCVVLGFTTRETVGDASELRSVLIGLAVDAETFVPLGTVSGFDASVDVAVLLDLLMPLVKESEFRRAASTGQLYRMVRPEVIVECKVMDLQAEDARGRAIRQPELTFTEDIWRVNGQVVAATAVNATVTRLRDDKGNVIEGARWAQIEDVVASPAAVAAHSASQVIRRRVWTKETKGKVDVRKLVVWRTNKETIDPTYPAYVVHWTDYSAGRKTPLTREVRPAPTVAAADALADALILDNIKKGWQEVP